MERGSDNNLDQIDLMLISELQIDGRQTITDLASKFGTGRATVRKKLDRLIDEHIIEVTAIAGHYGFKYPRTVAMVGINARLNDVRAVAQALASHGNVQMVSICAGRYDIIVWVAFRDRSSFSAFLIDELGKYPGVTSTESILNLQFHKVSFAYGRVGHNLCEQGIQARERAYVRPVLDQRDLTIIKELQANGRQSISNLAHKLGITRPTVQKKLQRLLDMQIIAVVAFASPNVFGYEVRAVLGLSVHANHVESVAERVSSYTNVSAVIICTGRYDILAWAAFKNTQDLSTFVLDELGTDQDITGTDIMIEMDIHKQSWAYLTPDDYTTKFVS